MYGREASEDEDLVFQNTLFDTDGQTRGILDQGDCKNPHSFGLHNQYSSPTVRGPQ